MWSDADEAIDIYFYSILISNSVKHLEGFRMIEQTVKIVNPEGLHGEVAKCMVDCACSFKGDVYMEKKLHRVNAKSYLGIIALGVMENDEVVLLIDGCDENKAVDCLTKIINSGFEDKALISEIEALKRKTYC